MELIIKFLPGFGVLALLFVFIKNSWVSKQEVGNDKMARIANNIADGAMSFLKAEYKEPIQFGDILIFKGDTFHKGGKNLSNEARHFIHISFKKTLQLNLNITNMLYNY